MWFYRFYRFLSHKLSRNLLQFAMRLGPCKCYLDLIFCRVQPYRSCRAPIKTVAPLFLFLLKIHFARIAKILHDLQGTPSRQNLMKMFSIWNLHTRMLRESGEFFLEFFEFKISIFQIFFLNRFWRQFPDSRLLPLVGVLIILFTIFRWIIISKGRMQEG